MTLVDTNLLVYASFPEAPEHAVTRAWLDRQQGEHGIVLCWPVAYSFVRLVSNRRAFGRAARTIADAWAAVERYLAHPSVGLVVPGRGHAAIATELLATPGLHSRDVPDVELAALAIEHGLVLASHDSGFRRFSGLRFVDPLG